MTVNIAADLRRKAWIYRDIARGWRVLREGKRAARHEAVRCERMAELLEREAEKIVAAEHP